MTCWRSGRKNVKWGKMLAQRRGRQVGLVGGAAPDVVAGVDGLHVRCDLLAHTGPDAVAADQQVGALGLAFGEAHAHLAAVLIDALEGATEVIALGRDRLAQQALEPVPGRQDLLERALADDAPLGVDGDAPVDGDAEVARARSAQLERLQQFRVAGDAGAAADELHRRALVDIGVPADLAQEGRGEEARHRAADDDGAPAASLAAGAGHRRPPARFGTIGSSR